MTRGPSWPFVFVVVLFLLGYAAGSQPRLEVDETHRVALAVSPWLQISAPGRWLVTVRVYPHPDHAALWVSWETGRSGMTLRGDREPPTVWSRRPIQGVPAGHYTITATVLDRQGRVCGSAHVQAIVKPRDLDDLLVL